jgi:hypothetical protein
MFSDREWELLRRVESDVVADDPEFARSFEAELEKLHNPPRHRGVMRVAVAVAALLAAGMLLAGSPLGAMAVLVMAALVWVVWRYSDITEGGDDTGGTGGRHFDPMM